MFKNFMDAPIASQSHEDAQINPKLWVDMVGVMNGTKTSRYAQMKIIENRDGRVVLECATHGRQEYRKAQPDEAVDCPLCSEETQRELQEFERQEALKAEREAAERQRRAAEKQRQEAEQAKRQRLESLGQCGIGLMYQEARLDNCRILNPEQERVLKAMQAYQKRFEESSIKGQSLILTGSTGTGKTHMACALANYLYVELNYSIRFIKAYRLFNQIKRSFNRQSKTEFDVEYFMTELMQCDLLILDELGVTQTSDYEKEILIELLDARYENIRPSILISNVNPRDFPEMLGNRLADRLRQTSISLECHWPSIRPQLRQHEL